MVSRELEERSVRTIIIIIITVVSPPDRGDLELLSTVSDVIPHRRRRSIIITIIVRNTIIILRVLGAHRTVLYITNIRIFTRV